MNPIKKFMSRRGALARFINGRAMSWHRAFENLNYDFDTNGELYVLDTIVNSDLDVKTVFDVGANRGVWSAMASEKFSDAQINSFEILEKTYQHLIQRCGNLENVSCYNFGMSSKKETTTVEFSSKSDGLTTLVKDFMEDFQETSVESYEVEVVTGDGFCQERGIGQIDFLKIDVEGYESHVLEGFEQMLSKGAIKVIQFEYGYINIATHFLLKDFYDLLGKYDMVLGKVYPDHVAFKPYEYTDENFFGPNYLAVHKSQEGLIKRLAKG